MFESIANRIGNSSLPAWRRMIVVGSTIACVVLSACATANAAAEFRGVQLNVSDPAAAAQLELRPHGGHAREFDAGYRA